MRISLTEIQQIESYLLNKLPAEDSLVFEAHMLTNAGLKSNVGLQQTLYKLLAVFQRRKVRNDILLIHSKLFFSKEKRSFQDRIGKIFEI